VAQAVQLRRRPCAADHGRLPRRLVPAGEESALDRVSMPPCCARVPVDAQRRAVPKDRRSGDRDGRPLSVLPLGTAREAFAQGGAPEKKT